ncbi:MAG TPA: hypothetical protein VGN59_10040 [Acidimicrobiia bacterium]|jgi:hypothetical protein
MERELRDALQELSERTASCGAHASQQALVRSLGPSRGRVLTANDVDSAVVRWADELGFDAVPVAVDDAAERVVRALDSTPALHP